MKKEPYFELFRDSIDTYGFDRFKINVNWNGRFMPLVDVLKEVEAPFLLPEFSQRDYGWPDAEEFYDHLAGDLKDRRWCVVACPRGGFYKEYRVAVHETSDTVTWKSFPMKSHKIPFGFRERPCYPDFVFEKKLYYEGLSAYRSQYEEMQRERDKETKGWILARARSDEWNFETFDRDFDASSIVRPRHEGPIFEILPDTAIREEGNAVKINVEWNDKRMPLIDVLKIWEKPFADPPGLAGNYDWYTATRLYSNLKLGPKYHPFFHCVLWCDCHNDGCWPFYVEVIETDDLVIWTNFRQPHRNRYPSCYFWDYSRYPPLVFDKKQYYEELEQLRPAYEHFVDWRKEFTGQ